MRIGSNRSWPVWSWRCGWPRGTHGSDLWSVFLQKSWAPCLHALPGSPPSTTSRIFPLLSHHYGSLSCCHSNSWRGSGVRAFASALPQRKNGTRAPTVLGLNCNAVVELSLRSGQRFDFGSLGCREVGSFGAILCTWSWLWQSLPGRSKCRYYAATGISGAGYLWHPWKWLIGRL